MGSCGCRVLTTRGSIVSYSSLHVFKYPRPQILNPVCVCVPDKVLQQRAAGDGKCVQLNAAVSWPYIEETELN